MSRKICALERATAQFRIIDRYLRDACGPVPEASGTEIIGARANDGRGIHDFNWFLDPVFMEEDCRAGVVLYDGNSYVVSVFYYGDEDQWTIECLPGDAPAASTLYRHLVQKELFEVFPESEATTDADFAKHLIQELVIVYQLLVCTPQPMRVAPMSLAN